MSSSRSNMAWLSAVSSPLAAGQTSSMAARGRLTKGREKGEALGGAGGLLLVALAETLDAAGGVDELLFSREEGVTLAADLEPQLLLRGAGRPGLAARAVDEDLVQFGMDLGFHGTRDSTDPGPRA